jgi:hypothetical protein
MGGISSGGGRIARRRREATAAPKLHGSVTMRSERSTRARASVNERDDARHPPNESVGGEGVVDEAPRRVPARRHEHVLGGRVAPDGEPALRERVPCPQHAEKALGEEGLGAQSVVRRREDVEQPALLGPDGRKRARSASAGGASPVRRARGEQRVERAHHDLGDTVGHREDEHAVVGRGVEGHRDVDEALRGGDDLPRGAAKLLGEGRPREHPPHAHQQRVVELRPQATERVARRRGGDREAARRAGDVRLLQKEVQARTWFRSKVESFTP